MHIYVMAKTAPLIVPASASSALRELGRSLKRARLARRDTQEVAAERLGVHAQTIARIEDGDPRVAAGTLFAYMGIYGRDRQLDALAEDDELTLSLARKALPKRGTS